MNTNQTQETKSNVVALRAQDAAKSQPPAVKTEMTFEQAQNAVRGHMLKLYRAAVEEKQEAFAALEAAVGGSTSALDHAVLNQGEAWMTRLALIGNRLESTYNHPQHAIASVVKKSVVEVSKVVAVLRAATLTHRADGLFREVQESDYVRTVHDRVEKTENVLAFIAPDMRDAAQSWLTENVTIVKPTPPAPAVAPTRAPSPNGPTRANGSTKTLIVATLPAAVADAKLDKKPATPAPSKPEGATGVDKAKTTPRPSSTAKKTPAKAPAKKGAAKRK